MRLEDVREALVDLGRLVGAAADQHDALLAQAYLNGRPVDLARLELLLDPRLHHSRTGVLRAACVGRLEQPVAVAVAARPTLATPDAPGRLRAAHHAAGAVDGREQRLGCLGGPDAVEDHRLVAHRA